MQGVLYTMRCLDACVACAPFISLSLEAKSSPTHHKKWYGRPGVYMTCIVPSKSHLHWIVNSTLSLHRSFRRVEYCSGIRELEYYIRLKAMQCDVVRTCERWACAYVSPCIYWWDTFVGLWLYGVLQTDGERGKAALEKYIFLLACSACRGEIFALLYGARLARGQLHDVRPAIV